jgi:hypothetical protein
MAPTITFTALIPRAFYTVISFTISFKSLNIRMWTRLIKYWNNVGNEYFCECVEIGGSLVLNSALIASNVDRLVRWKAFSELVCGHVPISLMQGLNRTVKVCVPANRVTVPAYYLGHVYVLWVAPPINVGSGSDDRIYLAAHITTCLNYTYSYSAIAIPHIEQSLLTLIHRGYFQQSSSPTAYSSNTHCNCRHSQLALTITLCNTLIRYTHWLAHWYWFITAHYTSQLYSLNYTTLALSCITLHSLHWMTYAHWLCRSTHISSERSERTRRKHRLRYLFYCRVKYHVIIQASHWSAGGCPAENRLLPLRNLYCCLTSPAHAPSQDCCVILLGYRVTAVAQCLEQIRHSILYKASVIIVE